MPRRRSGSGSGTKAETMGPRWARTSGRSSRREWCGRASPAPCRWKRRRRPTASSRPARTSARFCSSPDEAGAQRSRTAAADAASIGAGGPASPGDDPRTPAKGGAPRGSAALNGCRVARRPCAAGPRGRGAAGPRADPGPPLPALSPARCAPRTPDHPPRVRPARRVRQTWGMNDRMNTERQQPEVVLVSPEGMTIENAGHDERESNERPVTEMVGQPAKVMRIGSMIRQLLEEVRAAPLDEKSRARLHNIHHSSIKELEGGLAPDLVAKLERLSLPL